MDTAAGAPGSVTSGAKAGEGEAPGAATRETNVRPSLTVNIPTSENEATMDDSTTMTSSSVVKAESGTAAADSKSAESAAADSKTDSADTKTDAADTKTDAADTKTDAADTKTDAADSNTAAADSKTGMADSSTAGIDSKFPIAEKEASKDMLVRFELRKVNTPESCGELKLKIIRVGNVSSPLSCRIDCVDDTAEADKHYVLETAVLDFAQDQTEQFARMIIYETESTCRFVVRATPFASSGDLGEASECEIYIVNRTESWLEVIRKSSTFGYLIAFMTVFALFAHDIWALSLAPKHYDNYLGWVTVACLLTFVAEFIMLAAKDLKFLTSGTAILDAIAIFGIFTLIRVDVGSIELDFSRVLFGGAGSVGALARTSRVARVGSRAGRATKIPKLLGQCVSGIIDLVLCCILKPKKDNKLVLSDMNDAEDQGVEMVGMEETRGARASSIAYNVKSDAKRDELSKGAPGGRRGSDAAVAAATGDLAATNILAHIGRGDKEGEIMEVLDDGQLQVNSAQFVVEPSKIGGYILEVLTSKITLMMLVLLVAFTSLEIVEDSFQKKLGLQMLSRVAYSDTIYGPTFNETLGVFTLGSPSGSEWTLDQPILYLKVNGTELSTYSNHAAIDKRRYFEMTFTSLTSCGGSDPRASDLTSTVCSDAVIYDIRSKKVLEAQNGLILTFCLIVIVTVGMALIALDFQQLILDPIGRLKGAAMRALSIFFDDEDGDEDKEKDDEGKDDDSADVNDSLDESPGGSPAHSRSQSFIGFNKEMLLSTPVGMPVFDFQEPPDAKRTAKRTSERRGTRLSRADLASQTEAGNNMAGDEDGAETDSGDDGEAADVTIDIKAERVLSPVENDLKKLKGRRVSILDQALGASINEVVIDSMIERISRIKERWHKLHASLSISIADLESTFGANLKSAETGLAKLNMVVVALLRLATARASSEDVGDGVMNQKQKDDDFDYIVTELTRIAKTYIIPSSTQMIRIIVELVSGAKENKLTFKIVSSVFKAYGIRIERQRNYRAVHIVRFIARVVSTELRSFCRLIQDDVEDFRVNARALKFVLDSNLRHARRANFQRGVRDFTRILFADLVMLRLRDFGVMEGVEDLVNLPAEKMMTRAESLLVERGLAELKKGNFELQTKANRRLTLAKLHAQVRKRVVASRRESRIKGYESKSNAAGNEVRDYEALGLPESGPLLFEGSDSYQYAAIIAIFLGIPDGKFKRPPTRHTLSTLMSVLRATRFAKKLGGKVMRAGLRSLFSLGGTILVSNQPIRNACSRVANSPSRFRAVWSILKLGSSGSRGGIDTVLAKLREFVAAPQVFLPDEKEEILRKLTVVEGVFRKASDVLKLAMEWCDFKSEEKTVSALNRRTLTKFFSHMGRMCIGQVESAANKAGYEFNGARIIEAIDADYKDLAAKVRSTSQALSKQVMHAICVREGVPSHELEALERTCDNTTGFLARAEAHLVLSLELRLAEEGIIEAEYNNAGVDTIAKLRDYVETVQLSKRLASQSGWTHDPLASLEKLATDLDKFQTTHSVHVGLSLGESKGVLQSLPKSLEQLTHSLLDGVVSHSRVTGLILAMTLDGRLMSPASIGRTMMSEPEAIARAMQFGLDVASKYGPVPPALAFIVHQALDIIARVDSSVLAEIDALLQKFSNKTLCLAEVCKFVRVVGPRALPSWAVSLLLFLFQAADDSAVRLMESTGFQRPAHESIDLKTATELAAHCTRRALGKCARPLELVGVRPRLVEELQKEVSAQSPALFLQSAQQSFTRLLAEVLSGAAGPLANIVKLDAKSLRQCKSVGELMGRAESSLVKAASSMSGQVLAALGAPGLVDEARVRSCTSLADLRSLVDAKFKSVLKKRLGGRGLKVEGLSLEQLRRLAQAGPKGVLLGAVGGDAKGASSAGTENARGAGDEGVSGPGVDGPDTDEKCASDSKQADSKKSSKSLDTIVAAYNALQKRFPPDPSTLLKKVLGAVPGLGQFQWLLDSASGGPSQGLINGIYASMRYGTRGISIKKVREALELVASAAGQLGAPLIVASASLAQFEAFTQLTMMMQGYTVTRESIDLEQLESFARFWARKTVRDAASKVRARGIPFSTEEMEKLLDSDQSPFESAPRVAISIFAQLVRGVSGRKLTKLEESRLLASKTMPEVIATGKKLLLEPALAILAQASIGEEDIKVLRRSRSIQEARTFVVKVLRSKATAVSEAAGGPSSWEELTRAALEDEKARKIVQSVLEQESRLPKNLFDIIKTPLEGTQASLLLVPFLDPASLLHEGPSMVAQPFVAEAVARHISSLAQGSASFLPDEARQSVIGLTTDLQRSNFLSRLIDLLIKSKAQVGPENMFSRAAKLMDRAHSNG